MLVPDPVLTLAAAIRAAGGRLFVVGGAVRDGILGVPPVDLDLEVHGLDERALAKVLRAQGTARRVGRAYPVFKLTLPGQPTLDVALPRAQGASGDTVVEAARHRDLTVNAMLYDPLLEQLLDPWGGERDLADRRLRAVDPDTFRADPLRALRTAVFAARLPATPDPDLVALCQSLSLADAAPERIGIELRKLWLQAPAPGIGLHWIAALGLGQDVLPGVDLGPRTQQAWDRAAAWRPSLEEPGDDARLALGWAVLLANHPNPLQVLDRADVYGVAGRPVRDQVLAALAAPCPAPGDDLALLRLAEQGPVWLALRRHAAWSPDGPALALRARAAELGVATAALPALLQGRDLVALGVVPGPALGEALAALRQAQLSGLVSTPDQARTWVRGRIGCPVDAPPAQDEPAG